VIILPDLCQLSKNLKPATAACRQ